jgi:hypothetical protein
MPFAQYHLNITHITRKSRTFLFPLQGQGKRASLPFTTDTFASSLFAGLSLGGPTVQGDKRGKHLVEVAHERASAVS